MWTFFVISFIGINISIIVLIRKYADKGVEWIVRIATAYAWLTSMLIVALVPLDVWTTLDGVTQGRTFVGVLWSISYWSTQLATWLVLPFYQVYSEAGDFSVKERAWTSIKENALLYGTVGVIGIIGIALLFMFQVIDFNGMLGLGVGLSNAFGLIVGLLLLGYGLVEIPRQLWKGSNPEMLLKWAAHRSGKYAEEVMKARVELRDVITIIYANQRQMRRHDPLQKYMEVVFEYAERESPVKPSELANRNVEIDHLRAEDLEYNYDKKGLAALRRRLFWAIAEYRGSYARYADVVVEALGLEAVVKARATQTFVYTGPTPGQAARPWDQLAWVYDTRVRPYANRFWAVLLVIASFCIVWGEITIPVNTPDMSPFSLLIRSVDKSDEFLVQLFTILPLVYICACMYYTLFRINAFNYNKLIAGASTGAALMQNGSLMCRFAAPTCWNFYHIIHMTKDFCQPGQSSQCIKTVFDEKMASLSVLPSFLNLNLYLPVILGVHCVLTALNLWDRLLNCCTRAKYRFTDDDVEDEYTEKGRLLIRKEADAMAMGYKVGDILATAYVDLQFPPVKGMERAGTGQQPAKGGGFFSGLFGKKVIEPQEPLQQPPPSQIIYSQVTQRAGAGAGAGDGAGPSGANGGAPPRHYQSVAAQAASRWLTKGGGNAPASGGAGAGAGGGVLPGAEGAAGAGGLPHIPSGLQLNTDNTAKVSLLGARMDNSSSPDFASSSDQGGGGGGRAPPGAAAGGAGGGVRGFFGFGGAGGAAAGAGATGGAATGSAAAGGGGAAASAGAGGEYARGSDSGAAPAASGLDGIFAGLMGKGKEADSLLPSWKR